MTTSEFIYPFPTSASAKFKSRLKVIKNSYGRYVYLHLECFECVLRIHDHHGQLRVEVSAEKVEIAHVGVEVVHLICIMRAKILENDEQY